MLKSYSRINPDEVAYVSKEIIKAAQFDLLQVHFLLTSITHSG